MATISELNIRLGLQYQQFDRQLAAFERNVQRGVARMSAAGDSLTRAFSIPLLGLGALSVQAAAKFESLGLAMETTMLGAARGTYEASQEVKALQRAALAPGLDFEQAVTGSVRLQSVGFSAEKARAVLAELGNQIASSGGSAPQLDAVSKQFSQIIGKGKILQEDLSIILENMPSLAKVLKEEFGTTSAEGIRALGVSAEDFIDRITTRMQTLPRATGGIANTIVNFGVSIRQSAATIGENLNKAFNISGNLEAFAKWVTDLTTWFSKLDDGTKRLALSAGVFLAAFGPALKLVTGIVSVTTSAYASVLRLSEAFKAMQTTGTGTLAILSKLSVATRIMIFSGAIAAVLALVVAFKAFNVASTGASEAQRIFADSQRKVTEEAAQQSAALNRNFDILKNTTSSTLERKAAIDALVSTYPQYLSKVQLETASLTKLSEIQGALNSQILKGVAERQKSIAVEDQYNKVASSQLRITQLREQGFAALTGEEVKRAGLSLFGTDFEKQFVSAGARAEAVRKVIGLLDQDAKSAGKTATELAAQFDRTFAIGSQAGKSTVDASTANRQAYEDAKDAYEDMSPAQRELIDLQKKWAEEESQTKNFVKDRREMAKATKEQWEELSKVNEQLEIGNEQLAKATIGEIKRLTPVAPSIAQSTPTQPKLPNIPSPLGPAFDSAPSIDPSRGIEAMKQLQAAVMATSLAFTEFGVNGKQIMTDLNNGTILFSEAWTRMSETVLQNGSAMQVLGLALGQAFTDAFASGAQSAKGFAMSFLASAAKIIKAQIQIAVTNAALKALESAPFPYNLIIAGVAGAAAGALFSALVRKVGIPALAGGGVLKKPTMFLGGEYPGASTNPEIVSPESKLRSIFRQEAGYTGPMELFSVIRGSDLLLVTDRANANRDRVR